jgi:putative colanic acid biosynthesis acetyltransferase WcaF
MTRLTIADEPVSMKNPTSEVRLRDFRPSADRERQRGTEALWYLVKTLFLLSSIPWPIWLKVTLLRSFGARIGRGVVIAPRVNIHMPWKLTIGDDAWIGEEVFILNLEPISIGANSCVSQRTFLCTGNHDYRSSTFDYIGRPIVIGDGAWIGAQSFVGPGVSIGVDTVVTAGSVVLSNLPDKQICSGNPCEPSKSRVIRPER